MRDGHYNSTAPPPAQANERMYLQEIEAVGSPAGIFLDRLRQIFSIFDLTATQHFGHVHRHLLVAPVQLVDVRVVAALHAFVGVFRPGWLQMDIKKRVHSNFTSRQQPAACEETWFRCKVSSPVEFVEPQLDFCHVGLPVAAPVAIDLLDAADAERIGSVQV